MTTVATIGVGIIGASRVAPQHALAVASDVRTHLVAIADPDTARAEPIEGLHHGLNSLVQNARFALYRDFPDAHRRFGEEKF